MDDPLPSWTDGPVKAALRRFVEEAAREGAPGFVPPSRRIAAFDNDGTLWCEQPLQVQVFFALDRLNDLAALDPSLKTREPYRAFLERDRAAIEAMGKQAVFTLAFAVHAGMAVDDFDRIASDWLVWAKHPHLGRRFVELVYQPQLELLAFLRTAGFKSFIVTGGGADFVRAFAQDIYGIPPEQVVGSSLKTRVETRDDRVTLVKSAELDSFDDREAKPQNIRRQIGRRPVLAFGNSDGDLAMLRYTLGGDGPRLALLLHHDDAEREFAYDREFRLSPLAEALDHADDYGLTRVSMKRDWKSVFAA